MIFTARTQGREVTPGNIAILYVLAVKKNRNFKISNDSLPSPSIHPPMHPKELFIKDYTYELPPDRIAKYPLSERDQSKLLCWKNGQIEESDYANIADRLPAGSLLVFNNTKVVEARLTFEKSNGSNIEIFCLEPHEQYGDITTAMLQREKVLWKCMVGGAKKWKDGPLVANTSYEKGPVAITAKKIAPLADAYLIELSWEPAMLSFAELLHIAGAVPLPPYLNRQAESSDKTRYQTIYARYDGSVAAPTAGLHFTEKVFSSFQKKNIAHDFVTLHVGAGTFKPVKATTMEAHQMHAEFFEVSKSFIQKLAAHLSAPVVAVGTTSLRTLESLYWLGVKTMIQPSVCLDEMTLTQWEAYETGDRDIDSKEALQSLLDWMEQHHMEKLLGKTQIIIAPGYRFRIINGLITNFHQPQSTLLLLVAAITGDDWRKIYEYALRHDFRFLSYGDGSLLWL